MENTPSSGIHPMRIHPLAVVQRDVWLNIAVPGAELKVGRGTNIGRRCVISSAKSVVIEENVLLSPNALIMDHQHEYRDPWRAVIGQGITEPHELTIGDGRGSG